MSNYISRVLTYHDGDGVEHKVAEADLACLPGPVVILGDPGMGKTKLLEALDLSADHHYVTARKFIRSPDPQSLCQPGRILVIDALDEVAAARESDPINQVLAQLAKAGRPPFMLSCRGADWQGAIGRQDIYEEYDQEPKVLTLAPVSREEALNHLAVDLGQARSEALLGELDARALQALYGNPLMLTLIGKLVLEHGQLPATRHELYDQSCDLLRKENNKLRAASHLATMSRAAVLDAAGGACAALLLSGAEAISLEAPGQVANGDLHIAEVAELPGVSPLVHVLGSKLFSRQRGGDRFAPIHRTIAEFLGARWLAGRLPQVGMRRLMGLLTFNGGVPASLRGLHAWVGDFDPALASAVVANDVYGFIRYGDPSTLSDNGLRELLAALRALSVDNPHFHDWSQQAAPSLARSTLVREIGDLIFDRTSAFHLRMLLLEAIEGQEIVDGLADRLKGLVVNGGKDRGSFAERRAAADALIAAPQLKLDWPKLLRTLHRRSAEDCRRLAVEIMAKIGPGKFAARQVAEAALAYLNLLPGLASTERTDTVGVLYVLGVAIPDDQISAVLDAVAAFKPSPRSTERGWETRYAFSEFVDTLVTRQFAVRAPEPIQLLNWLRLARKRDGYNTDRRKDITQALIDRTALRRAIQHQVLLVETDHESLWGRFWRMTDFEPGLAPTSADVIWLVEQAKLDAGDPEQREVLFDLIRLDNRPTGLSSDLLAALAPIAAAHSEVAAFLEAMRKNRIPEWQRKDEARRRRENRQREARWARHRSDFSSRAAGIASGELNDVYAAAQCYLGRFHDIDRKLAPNSRVEQWLGEALSASMLFGFEAVLHRQDLPSAAAVADSYALSKYWHYMLPMLAGLIERVRSSRGLEDLSEDVLIAAKLGLLHEHIDKDTGGEDLEAALSAWFAERPQSAERLARLAIEPQIRQKQEHVRGLYLMMRARRPQPLTVALAQEWLETFTTMTPTAEYEMVGHLLRAGRWDAIRQIADRRLTAGYRDDDHAKAWLAIGFVTDFETHRAALTAAAAQDPDLLWFIRTWRGEARRNGANEQSTPVAASVPALLWLIETFRPKFPGIHRPPGPSGGDRNPYDAADFLRAIISILGGDTNDEALAAMNVLRDAPSDLYSDLIRQVRAEQITARRETDFKPAAFAEIQAVVMGAAPRTVADVKAIALDALAMAQAMIQGDDLESVSLFYDAGEPLGENDCRDRLGVLLRGLLPFGIDINPERTAPSHTRADMAITLGRLHLPVEAKGQWHAKLWSAAQAQLDQNYTRDWRAEGAGIYLVFWFGSDAPPKRKLRAPPRGQARPETPEQLQEALAALVPDHRRGDIAIVVLDVSGYRARPGHHGEAALSSGRVS
jgi:hypothetical protein